MVLAKFQQLYDIEDRAKTMSADERLALRQAEAVPVWQSLGEWLAGDAVARGAAERASSARRWIICATSGSPAVVLSDGRMPIDNNEVEQLMKQVALGRKNWLFIGSVRPASGRPTCSHWSAARSATTWTCGPTSRTCWISCSPAHGLRLAPSGRLEGVASGGGAGLSRRGASLIWGSTPSHIKRARRRLTKKR